LDEHDLGAPRSVNTRAMANALTPMLMTKAFVL
jgi:hypothetical protein